MILRFTNSKVKLMLNQNIFFYTVMNQYLFLIHTYGRLIYEIYQVLILNNKRIINKIAHYDGKKL